MPRYPPRHIRPTRKNNPVGSAWITNFKPIGNGAYGHVYVGRFKTALGKSVRVAIKVFTTPISNEQARAYQEVIDILHQGGVRLPKMKMVFVKWHPDFSGKWVQVSQFFGSNKESKLVNQSILRSFSPKQKEEAVHEFTKIANVRLDVPYDIMEPFRNPEKGTIPIDIDTIVRQYLRRGKKIQKWEAIADVLVSNIRIMENKKSERERLRELAIKLARKELHHALLMTPI